MERSTPGMHAGHARQGQGSDQALTALLTDLRACRLCADLPLGPRPIIRASTTARVVICGQAPGTRVHHSGLSWNDPSGDRLRQWLAIGREDFYDESRIAVVPQGFCYPGKGAQGDLPPRRECATTWHARVFAAMPQIEVVVLAGQYAIAWHLGTRRKATLTETVRAWRDYAPRYFALPHPSWHNNRWLKQNPWFEAELVPALRTAVHPLVFG